MKVYEKEKLEKYKNLIGSGLNGDKLDNCHSFPTCDPYRLTTAVGRILG